MKLAFSTLGCPRWDFNEIFCTAKDLGFDGIEIRGVANQMYAPHIEVFSEDKIVATLNKIKAANFCIPILSSGACLAVQANANAAIIEAEEYIALASKLGTPFVRVMCTNSPSPNGGDLELAKKLYTQACRFGEKYGVMPLIETNGLFCDSKVLAEFLDGIDSGNKGALWDIHHTYRFGGEDTKSTWQNLSKYIMHVHIKDSIILDGNVKYKMLGYGDIPIFDTIDMIKAADFDGYVSLEWVKRWNTDLEEPGIVFAHFIECMSKYKE